MQDDTSWTPSPEENLLNLIDKALINQEEAKGIATAELFIFSLDTETPISTSLILNIHQIAFGNLYEWAGKWRTTNITVGQLQPPQYYQVVQLMYQFVDNLNFKISISHSQSEHIECLLYAHYEFIRIHPFNNGNGRTGRMLMNIVAMKLGYKPLFLYHREGDSRKNYISAMRLADAGNYTSLHNLILSELSAF